VSKKLVVHGIRGIPAKHGGFETFAEYLCLYLIKKGWSVTVYCQEKDDGAIYNSTWEGVNRVHIPIKGSGALSTILFDFKSILHSRRNKSLHLTLGYNTAIFNVIQRIYGIKNVINMDGIEWKRQKWSFIAKTWFWINERLGCWLGDHLVADHPSIKEHLSTRVSTNKITMIPYGGLEVSTADEQTLGHYNIKKDEYALVVARPEPENSILEIVEGFSSKQRNMKLVVLGDYDPTNSYHKSVLDSASNEVLFAGAIYDISQVSELRYHTRCYVHGHQVGGTNPSLVESLGAGNAIVAHDNKFNRWVAKEGAVYFNGADSVSDVFDLILNNDDCIERLKENTRVNFDQNFRWEMILKQYDELLTDWFELGEL
jgi:glycosyltransferase involved in cell wall biosynthesis